MKNRTFIIISSGLMLWAAILLPLSARVFWRRSSPTEYLIAQSGAPWQKVYGSTVRINNGRGQLDILTCPEDISVVAATLRQAFPAIQQDGAWRQGKDLFCGMVTSGAEVTRFLALAPGPLGQTVLFILRQNQQEYTLAQQPPPRHLLEAIPPYPGSESRLFCADEAAAAQLEMSYCMGGTAGSMLDFYESLLVGQGWHSLLPATGNRSLAIYQKDMAVCCVLAQDSMITLLHKRLQIK